MFVSYSNDVEAAKSFVVHNAGKFSINNLTLGVTRATVEKRFGKSVKIEEDMINEGNIHYYKNGYNITYGTNGKAYEINMMTGDRNALNSFTRAYKGTVYKLGTNSYLYVNMKTWHMLHIRYIASKKRYDLRFTYLDGHTEFEIKQGSFKKVTASAIKY
jgi:hypothetical protein